MPEERWETDDDLARARQRFADRIPGFEWPAAYTVARVDNEQLRFGHLNEVGGLHRLPAVVLASVCGYVAETGTFELTRDQFATAIELLSPAEAAAHWDHPNLWSWRELLESAGPDSQFVAIFVRSAEDPPANRHDAEFRARLDA